MLHLCSINRGEPENMGMEPIQAAAVLLDFQSSTIMEVPPPLPSQVREALQAADRALLAQAALDGNGRRARLRTAPPDIPVTAPLRRAWETMTADYTDVGVAVVCEFSPSVITTLFRAALEANGYPVDDVDDPPAG